MSPVATALARWVETLANGSANLDPLTRARLGALAGHSIAVELDPPGETTTLHFERDSVRLIPGSSGSPSVIVRGDAATLAAAFFGAGRGRITIDGDEVVLQQFRSILVDYRPDVLSPLTSIVGKDAAQAITSVIEIGFAAVAALGRSLGEEGGRLARGGARQKYLTTPEFESLQDATRSLRTRLDRLKVRTALVENDRSEGHE